MYAGKKELVIDRVFGVTDPKAKAFIDGIAVSYECGQNSYFTIDLLDLEYELSEPNHKHKEAAQALVDYMKSNGVDEVTITYWW